MPPSPRPSQANGRPLVPAEPIDAALVAADHKNYCYCCSELGLADLGHDEKRGDQEE